MGTLTMVTALTSLESMIDWASIRRQDRVRNFSKMERVFVQRFPFCKHLNHKLSTFKDYHILGGLNLEPEI